MNRFTALTSFALGGLMTAAALATPPTPDIAHWAFDNNGDDAVGSNHASLSGTSFSTDAAEGSHSLLFSGTSHLAEIPKSTSTSSYTQRSVSLWFNADAVSGRQVLIDLGGKGNGAAIRLNAGNIEGVVLSSGSPAQIVSAPATPGVWTHVAMVFDAGALQLWVDGVMEQELLGGHSPAKSHSNRTAVGSRKSQDSFVNSGDGDYFAGKIDDVRLYSFALTATEIADLAGTTGGGGGGGGGPVTETLTAVEDTYIKGNKLNTPQSYSNSLLAGLHGGTYQHNSGAVLERYHTALFRFDTTNLPTGDLLNAKLRVNIENAPGYDLHLRVVVYSDDSWNEATTEGFNMPLNPLPVNYVKLPGGTSGMYEFDISHTVLSDVNVMADGDLTVALVGDDRPIQAGTLTITSIEGGTPAELELDFGTFSADDVAIQTGLVSWRKPDPIGASCADCHGPGFDLALFDYDAQADIVRRALNHVNQTESEDIADMVVAFRNKMGITPLSQDHLLFQPGGQSLTPGADEIEKDRNFINHWENAGLLAFTNQVNSLAEAQAVANEMNNINLWDVQVGLPLMPWSRDIHHGDDNGLIREWIPVFPSTPLDTTDFYRLHDIYLDEPTDNNLWTIGNATALETHVPAIWKGSSGTKFAHLGLQQLLAALIGQHYFKDITTVGTSDFIVRDGSRRNQFTRFQPKIFNHHTPAAAWTAGDIGRQLGAGGQDPSGTITAADLVPGWYQGWVVENGLPQDEANKMSVNLSQYYQTITGVLAPWFYQGFLFDETTFFSGPSNSTFNWEYFPRAFKNDATGVVMKGHYLFFCFKRISTVRFDAAAMAGTNHDPHVILTSHMPGYDVNMPGNLSEFVDAAHRDDVEFLVDNFIRTKLYLLRDDLDTGYLVPGVTAEPPLYRIVNIADKAEQWLIDNGRYTTEMQTLISDIRAYLP